MNPAAGPWRLEVQIHPGDIRRRVRYLFLSRFPVTLVSLAALLYVAGIALAVAVAPGVVAGLNNRQEYRSLIAARRMQGERMQALVGRIDELDRRAQELDLRLGKVFLVYGLPPVPPRPAGAGRAEAGPPSIYGETLDQGRRLQARVRERLRRLDAALGEIQAFEGAHPEAVHTTPSACPLRGELVLIGSFGPRRSPFTHGLEFHPGADLAAPAGTPIYATADGVVAFAGQIPLARGAVWWRYGNLVVIKNDDGFLTFFGHDEGVEVRAGERVKRGDRIATVGSSGWGVTSPHVHYEVRRKGDDGVYRPVDPLVYILDRRWPNEDRLLLAARTAPPARDFEPLPPPIGR